MPAYRPRPRPALMCPFCGSPAIVLETRTCPDCSTTAPSDADITAHGPAILGGISYGTELIPVVNVSRLAHASAMAWPRGR